MRDAVTVVLCHDNELYMTRRRDYLAAFPGHQVFPGGTVDRDDLRAANGSPLLDAHEPRLMAALIRELREEIGFDLEEAAQAGRVESIQPIGRIQTPVGAPRRFDTQFYRVNLLDRPDFVIQAEEITDGEWASVAEWLGRYRDGRLLLAFPTRTVLNALNADPHCAAIDFENMRQPVMEFIHGLRTIGVPSNTLPPATNTNCFLLGDSDAHRVLVDPSPKSESDKAWLLKHSGPIGFHEVFLTHHHPDHREFADAIARECGVPLGASLDTQQRIRAKQPGFFDGLEVKTYAEGDVLTHWLGRPVRVIEVPGHDEGQLALMPDDRAWCIVGDLIQGIGTVVISAPEGNMRKYFRSLENIIALQPAVVVPSHGGPLGGVHYLQQTLAHRRAREAQVLELYGRGSSMDEMLAAIYTDLDPRLKPLALRNIDSHLQKLREEGLIPDLAAGA